jgi:4-amino-4-deoxy-L-arabinose transferase-like glycosyltransferase
VATSPGNSQPIRATWLLCVLIIAAIGCVLIVGQPVQVDDPLFLGMAKQILQTPMSPFAGTPAWLDRDWFSENANPPLWGYLLAATAANFGWNETAYQILQCLANVALTFGVFMLARRVCLRPVFWTAAAMLSPFLLPGRNLMADTLMLACWVWSFEFFLQDALDGQRGRGVYAGLLAAAALLTKYTGGLLAPIYLFLGWRWGRQQWWSWLIPSLVFAAWCGHNLHFYGRMHFFASASGGNIEIFDRVRVFARVVGAMVMWGPVWIVAGWQSAIGWRKGVLALSLPAAALASGADFWDAIVRLQLANVIIEGPVVAHFAGFMASGILAFAAFIAGVRINSDDSNDRARSALFVWVVAATTFNLVATSSIAFGAVRHLVVAIIPFVLLGGGAFDRLAVTRKGVVVCAWLTLFVSAALGGLIAHGDRLEAEAGVVAAKEAAALKNSGHQVWVAGDSAMRYHAERNGVAWARTDLSDVPVGGVVVTAYLRAVGYRQHPLFTSQARLLKRVVLESWNPVRAQETQVSFYGANLMTLPWMADFRRQAAGPMGGQPYDSILVYQRVK